MPFTVLYKCLCDNSHALHGINMFYAKCFHKKVLNLKSYFMSLNLLWTQCTFYFYEVSKRRIFYLNKGFYLRRFLKNERIGM
jgi:hypothetical protein